MSVIVKGMEMPKNCAECKMWSICDCLKEFDDYESLLYAVDDGDWVIADDCPLIELPSHGRLGDLDALQKQVENTIQDAHMSLLWKQGMMYAHGLVEASKTVIEAEGETE